MGAEKRTQQTRGLPWRNPHLLFLLQRVVLFFGGSGEVIATSTMPPDGMGGTSCEKASITGLLAKVRTIRQRNNDRQRRAPAIAVLAQCRIARSVTTPRAAVAARRGRRAAR